MYYESSDFLETADSDTLKQIARTRELTREYYFSDYGDIEKRTSILRELLGGIGENVLIDTPFHCDCLATGKACAGLDGTSDNIFQNLCTSDRDRKQRLDWRRLYSSSRSHYRRKQRDRGWKRSYPPCPS